MNNILAGCTGMLCLMNNVLVLGATQEEHDHNIDGVLARIQAAGVMLVRGKCVSSITMVKLLGHIIDQTGIRADPGRLLLLTKQLNHQTFLS